MDIFLIIAIVLLVVLLFVQNKRRIQDSPKRDYDKPKAPTEIDLTIPEVPETSTEPELNISGAYQKRWMFTYNEKDAYRKLKAIADELGYTVFAKVRLLDILEPQKGTKKYKTYFYKIQAKHVDFVLCDQKLVAKYIIELDDSSHDTQPRKERDEFVDQVLESVGYKIIHTRAITDDIKKQIVSTK